MSIVIGPFIVGEKPAPLEYQFLDANGAPLDLTGYTAKFVYREVDTVGTTQNASVTDAAAGEVTYIWQGIEFPTSGRYTGYIWVGNGINRFASDTIEWRARTSGAPVPSV